MSTIVICWNLKRLVVWDKPERRTQLIDSISSQGRKIFLWKSKHKNTNNLNKTATT